MKLEDEVRNRLHRAAERVVAPPADLVPVVRRGRRRRAGKIVGACLVGLSVIVVLTLTLGGLWSLHQGGPTRVIPGAGSSDRLVLGYGVALDRPPGWTVLIEGAGGDPSYDMPVFQLSNFDPGVLGDHPAGSWLCPLEASRLPRDGVVLMVTASGIADGSEPEWPVSLDPSQQSEGDCGQGAYATWQAGRAFLVPLGSDATPQPPAGSELSFEAFVAGGPEASRADVRTMLEAFGGLRFTQQDVPVWQLDAGPNPYAVLWTTVDAAQPEYPYVVPVTMHVEQYRDAAGVPQFCFSASGGWCELKRPDGSLYELWDDGHGGAREVATPNVRASSGHECPSDRHTVEGLVTDRATTLELRLDDGRVFEIPTMPTPASWNEPFRAFWSEVEGDASGTLVALDAAGNVLGRADYQGGGC